MPHISEKGRMMPASPIRKLVPYAEQAKREGRKVYHLNIGQPDIETPPEVFEAMRNIHFKVLEYSHSAGIESYRRKLAEFDLNPLFAAASRALWALVRRESSDFLVGADKSMAEVAGVCGHSRSARRK